MSLNYNFKNNFADISELKNIIESGVGFKNWLQKC
jgi:hypothetical protein